MAEISEVRLAQDHTEHYLRGIALGEAVTRSYGEMLGEEALPLVFESNEEADQARHDLGCAMVASVHTALEHQRFGVGDGPSHEETLAFKAGATAGYEHRIVVKEGEN
jgi:hypothetical protein